MGYCRDAVSLVLVILKKILDIVYAVKKSNEV